MAIDPFRSRPLVLPGSKPAQLARDDGRDEGYGLYRPAVNYRNGVAFVSVRRWRGDDTERIDYRRFRSAKRELDVAYLDAMAADIVRCVADLGIAAPYVTAPPQGVAAAWHFASGLARVVGECLGLAYVQAFEPRIRGGSSHHPRKTGERPPPVIRERPRGPVLIVDDFATSGFSITQALAAVREAQIEAIGVVWVYGSRT